MRYLMLYKPCQIRETLDEFAKEWTYEGHPSGLLEIERSKRIEGTDSVSSQQAKLKSQSVPLSFIRSSLSFDLLLPSEDVTVQKKEVG